MKVSIIIPIYNAEKYLDQCIKSALAQSYPNTEIIAIDDGSTDKSFEILQKYSDKIKIFQKANGGTASALNVGIDNMTGDWFKWASADDLLKPDAISLLIDTANTMIDIAKSHIFYGNHETVDENGDLIDKIIEPDHNSLSDVERNVLLLNGFWAAAGATIFHKSVFEKCGTFDESVKPYEDYEFWLRCCLLHGYVLYLIPQSASVMQYRKHSSSLTSQIKKEEEVHMNNKIRNDIMNKLPEQKRIKYLAALEEYKNLENETGIRKIIRNIVNALPTPISKKIRTSYMQKKLKKSIKSQKFNE